MRQPLDIGGAGVYYLSRLFRGRRGRRRGATSTRRSIDFVFTFKGLVLYKPILNFELTNRRGMVGRYLHRLAEKIVVDAKHQVGVKTGKLRRSIRIEHTKYGREQAVKIGSRLHYAYLHHEGTKPHIIVPKGAHTLRFMSKGVMVRTRLVRHPGTKPNRFLSDQLARNIR
jgi:hypothetical protein